MLLPAQIVASGRRIIYPIRASQRVWISSSTPLPDRKRCESPPRATVVCRDADALVALFAEGGTYSNPHAGQGLTGEAIGNYAKAVWAAFPDMTLELVSVREMGPGQVAHEWVLRGTNSGPLMDGSAATGRTVTVPGSDVIAVEGDKIRSVDVTYDRQAADAQLGATAT